MLYVLVGLCVLAMLLVRRDKALCFLGLSALMSAGTFMGCAPATNPVVVEKTAQGLLRKVCWLPGGRGRRGASFRKTDALPG